MTRPPPSLKVRLSAGVVGVLGLSLCVFSVVLYSAFSRALWRQFDERLAQDARTVANMVEERASGPWEFEPSSLDELDKGHGAAYFEVWMDDGAVIARSLSLGPSDLSRPPSQTGTVVVGTILADGGKGHLLLASLSPRHDEEGPAKPSGRRVTVAVARATNEVDATLATLRLLLLGSGLAALALAVLAGAFAIRGGLAPLARLAKRIDAMDAKSLDERLPVEDLPRELQPAVVRLNELLTRLEESFTRERRFSADVSHELRTPIAGLRTMLEVASSRERPACEYKAAIDEALGVALQMNGLVENLMMLARIDAHQLRIADEEIVVRDLVEDAFGPFAAKARERKLRFENLVPVDTTIRSDREKLRIVLSNLMANAFEYTAEEGQVTVEGAGSPEEVLAVCDSGPPIPKEDLERIFDRFFRLDSARSGSGDHCGVGLALARALCGVVGLSISAENRRHGSVAFTVRKVESASPPT